MNILIETAASLGLAVIGLWILYFMFEQMFKERCPLLAIILALLYMSGCGMLYRIGFFHAS